jgi:hypothetical protein
MVNAHEAMRSTSATLGVILAEEDMACPIRQRLAQSGHRYFQRVDCVQRRKVSSETDTSRQGGVAYFRPPSPTAKRSCLRATKRGKRCPGDFAVLEVGRGPLRKLSGWVASGAVASSRWNTATETIIRLSCAEGLRRSLDLLIPFEYGYAESQCSVHHSRATVADRPVPGLYFSDVPA